MTIGTEYFRLWTGGLENLMGSKSYLKLMDLETTIVLT